MKIKHTIIITVCLIFCGCHNTGVVKLSPDTYYISRSSGAGAFTNMQKLKANVIQEANRFAAQQGKNIDPISLTDTVPTHGFPSVNYQFRLVDVITNKSSVISHP